jgi:hypothetical protein
VKKYRRPKYGKVRRTRRGRLDRWRGVPTDQVFATVQQQSKAALALVWWR